MSHPVAKLLPKRQFQEVEKNSNGNYSTYRITGATTKWKKQPNFVYSYHLRWAGDKEAVIKAITELDDDKLAIYHSEFKKLEDKFELPDKELLIDQLIAKDNYKQSNLYQHEKEAYKEVMTKNKKEAVDVPTIEEVYEAFTQFKKNNIVNKTKKTLRMDNLGQIYNQMKTTHFLNVDGYSKADGKAEVVTVDDTQQNAYQIGSRVLFKVPNYPILSKTRLDLEYALRDLKTQSVISLSKTKLKSILKQWSEVKSTSK